MADSGVDAAQDCAPIERPLLRDGMSTVEQHPAKRHYRESNVEKSQLGEKIGGRWPAGIHPFPIFILRFVLLSHVRCRLLPTGSRVCSSRRASPATILYGEIAASGWKRCGRVMGGTCPST